MEKRGLAGNKLCYNLKRSQFIPNVAVESTGIYPKLFGISKDPTRKISQISANISQIITNKNRKLHKLFPNLFKSCSKPVQNLFKTSRYLFKTFDRYPKLGYIRDYLFKTFDRSGCLFKVLDRHLFKTFIPPIPYFREQIGLYKVRIGLNLEILR